MIANLIILFFFLAVAHFIYEAILLPSFRYSLRLDLFVLRDRLRKLALVHDKEICAEVFSHVESSINMALNIIPFVDWGYMAHCEHILKSDEGLRRRIQKRAEQIDQCLVGDVRQISREVGAVVRKAMFLNCAGSFILIIPIAFTAVCIGKIRAWIKSIILVPAGEEYKLAPSTDFVPSAA